jgi:hypothetical protein
MHDDIESRLRAAMEEAAQPVTGTGIDQEEVHTIVARRRRNRRLGFGGAGVALAAAALAGIVLLPSGDDGAETIRPAETSVPDPTTPSTSTTTSPTTTVAALPEFPPMDESLSTETTTWALYLAVVTGDEASFDYNAPELNEAGEAKVDAGYQGHLIEGEDGGPPYGWGLSCDVGAAEALGVPADTYAVAVGIYFDTEALANEAKAAFEARGTTIEGIAQVETECLE